MTTIEKTNNELFENITIIENYLYVCGTLLEHNTSLKSKASRIEFGKLVTEMAKVVRNSKAFDEKQSEEQWNNVL